MDKTVLGKLSIGYNRDKQRFFNLLNQYKDYIHSYYFNPLRMFDEYYDPIEFYNEFHNLNVFGIEGNIMFNSNDMLKHLTDDDIYNLTRKYIQCQNLNITSATVVNQHTIDLLKAIKPDIKIHISVRNTFDNIKDFKKNYNIEDIYCINLSSDNVFNLKLMKEFHKIGIKTKTIANLWCLYGREKINEKFNRRICSAPIAGCKLLCSQVLKNDFDWLNLTRQGYTKEFLPHFDNALDIIKLSTRNSSLEVIRSLLDIWTSTKNMTFYNCYFNGPIPIEFIKLRLKCNHKCEHCTKCINIFKKYSVKRLENGYVA